MLLELADSIFVKTETKNSITNLPRWILPGDTVIVAPYTSIKEHDLHIADTVGSFDILMCEPDEIRFDKKDFLLRSISFLIFESEVLYTSTLQKWSLLEPMNGSISLVTPLQNITIRTIADYRWTCPKSNILSGVSKVALFDCNDIYRLRITHDFDLMFSNQKLCGWMLFNPEKYIVGNLSDPVINSSDLILKQLTYDYLKLVTEPIVDKMANSDPHVYKLLIDFYSRVKAYNGNKIKQNALQEKIEDILDNFYG